MKTSFAMRRIFAVAVLGAGSLGVLRANSARSDGDSGWGFSEANLDRTCKPCQDFNQFAMGGWMKTNPIPPEYPNWGSFTMLADRNQTVLRGILEDAAKVNAASEQGIAAPRLSDPASAALIRTAFSREGMRAMPADLMTVLSMCRSLQHAFGSMTKWSSGVAGLGSSLIRTSWRSGWRAVD